jgi:hypothetical protein
MKRPLWRPVILDYMEIKERGVANDAWHFSIYFSIAITVLDWWVHGRDKPFSEFLYSLCFYFGFKVLVNLLLIRWHESRSSRRPLSKLS